MPRQDVRAAVKERHSDDLAAGPELRGSEGGYGGIARAAEGAKRREEEEQMGEWQERGSAPTGIVRRCGSRGLNHPMCLQPSLASSAGSSAQCLYHPSARRTRKFETERTNFRRRQFTNSFSRSMGLRIQGSPSPIHPRELSSFPILGTSPIAHRPVVFDSLSGGLISRLLIPISDSFHPRAGSCIAGRGPTSRLCRNRTEHRRDDGDDFIFPGSISICTDVIFE
ncbi:hypothetical protein DFH06DRAFT_113046 [Mycena polygramma]|nr:hypothetical protein DFH06DRAFT_113046 [Mycena polygramma]